MLFKTFVVYPDYVQIDRRTLERPSYISVSQWNAFWSLSKDWMGENDREEIWAQAFKDGQDESQNEISALEEEVERLEKELKDTEGDLADAENEIALREEQLDKEYERGHADGIIAGRLDSSL